jgi:hypothetical protein
VTVALCALILAAGEGTRLRPLTETLPKALTPVGNVPLVDLALTRLARHGLSGPALVAVNTCYLADNHPASTRAFVSLSPAPALGTSGAVANLRDWIAGRHVLIGNCDAYLRRTATTAISPRCCRLGSDDGACSRSRPARMATAGPRAGAHARGFSPSPPTSPRRCGRPVGAGPHRRRPAEREGGLS